MSRSDTFPQFLHIRILHSSAVLSAIFFSFGGCGFLFGLIREPSLLGGEERAGDVASGTAPVPRPPPIPSDTDGARRFLAAIVTATGGLGYFSIWVRSCPGCYSRSQGSINVLDRSYRIRCRSSLAHFWWELKHALRLFLDSKKVLFYSTLDSKEIIESRCKSGGSVTPYPCRGG